MGVLVPNWLAGLFLTTLGSPKTKLEVLPNYANQGTDWHLLEEGLELCATGQ